MHRGMNPKPASIRAFGQRSIASSFLSRSSNYSTEFKDKASKKDSGVSLSDFLDRKLHTTSVLPRTVQGKSRPFWSPLGLRESIGSNNGHTVAKKDQEAKSNCAIDKEVFEQFKQNGEDKGNPEGSCSEVGSCDIDEIQGSRKRRYPFEGGHEKHAARKRLLVLGEDPKPKQKCREEKCISKKKPRPLYNHYANGCGWWDCNMEGVDNEEVGFNEVWEGVGSTTLGGLEWH